MAKPAGAVGAGRRCRRGSLDPSERAWPRANRWTESDRTHQKAFRQEAQMDKIKQSLAIRDIFKPQKHQRNTRNMHSLQLVYNGQKQRTNMPSMKWTGRRKTAEQEVSQFSRPVVTQRAIQDDSGRVYRIHKDEKMRVNLRNIRTTQNAHLAQRIHFIVLEKVVVILDGSLNIPQAPSGQRENKWR